MKKQLKKAKNLKITKIAMKMNQIKKIKNWWKIKKTMKRNLKKKKKNIKINKKKEVV